MEAKRSCSHIGFWLAILILGLALAGSLAFNVGMALGLSLTGWKRVEDTAEDEFPKFTERWSWGEGEVKAVRIPVQGVLFRDAADGAFFAPKLDRIEFILRQIRAAKNDDAVKALILEVSSPGGDMTSVDEIKHAVEAFKASAPGRKVIAHVQEMAVSGGYYAVLPADWIIAEPTALLGSFGVILQTLNWKGLSEKLGVTDTTIKSGPHKDLLNPFQDVPTEQRALLQALIDRYHARFFDAIVAARGIEPERLREVADGRVFGVEVATNYHLIDQVGYWSEVLDHLPALLGEESVKIVRYEHKFTFSDWLTAWGGSFRLPRWMESEAPRLMYLWRP